MQQIVYRKESFSKIRTCSFQRNESKVIKRWMKPVIYKYINYIYSYITKLKKEKIITLLYTLMFSGIDILVKTWKDRNWYNGLYKKLVNYL